MHSYCLTCINRWIEVHRRCPLCNRTILSVVSNITSDTSFEEHVLPPLGREADVDSNSNYPGLLLEGYREHDNDGQDGGYVQPWDRSSFNEQQREEEQQGQQRRRESTDTKMFNGNGSTLDHITTDCINTYVLHIAHTRSSFLPLPIKHHQDQQHQQ